MLLFMLIFLAILIFGTSYVVTWGMMKYGLKRGLLDVPNHRSSHTVPVPRLGGLGPLVAMALGLFVVDCFFNQTFTLMSQLFMFAAAMSIMGWVDDNRSLPAKLKLMVQVLIVSLATILIAYNYSNMAHWSLLVLAWLFILWHTNLFNFMDGIDGIAGAQILTCGLSFMALSVFTQEMQVLQFGFILFVAALGFLVWNWSPAKIFMGDVGSTSFGFLVAAFVVIQVFPEGDNLSLRIEYIIPLNLFLVESTYVLLRRGSLGQKVMSAHRSHAYQHLHQLGWGHSKISTLYLAVNILINLPLAILCSWSQGPLKFLYLILSFVFPLMLCLKMRAGDPAAFERSRA